MGRPGLIGTMARTAVVAGTASAVAGGVSARQQRRATEAQEAAAYRQEQPPAAAAPAQTPPMASAPVADTARSQVDQLQRLVEMHGQGLLTDEEFAAAKSKLLGL
jgi:hypothetical protein